MREGDWGCRGEGGDEGESVMKLVGETRRIKSGLLVRARSQERSSRVAAQ